LSCCVSRLSHGARAMVELRIKGNVQQVLDIGRIRLLGSSLAVACISGRTEVQLTVATGGSGLENGRRYMRWQPSWVWYWYYFLLLCCCGLGLGSCLGLAWILQVLINSLFLGDRTGSNWAGWLGRAKKRVDRQIKANAQCDRMRCNAMRCDANAQTPD
jgi:hypothetical protein